MWPSLSSVNRTRLLAGVTLGTYLLVVLGATTSFADASQACSSWPVCYGLDSTAGLIVISHRLMAAIVGILLLVTVWQFRRDVSRRVGAALAFAIALYPIQIAVGALLATTGASFIPGLHLLAGLAIFGLLLVALAWHLEAETGQSEDSPTQAVETQEPVGKASDRSNPVPERSPDSNGGPKPDLDAEPVRTTGPVRFRDRVHAYVELTKPRLMWLLCLVAAASMAIAAGPALEMRTVVLTLGGGVLAIGASGTFNHVLERDVDQKMARTSDRPLARHEVPARNAVVFGLALTALSIAVFLQLNALAAALGLTAILFYSVIYTLVLKPNTVQNTVIGGAAGSLPALIGWAAVTGRIGLGGLLLAAFIFVWTPAHFYNLAMAYKDDYARGGFPMMPVVRGETETRKHVLWWLGATFATAVFLLWLTTLGWVTGLVSVLVGTVFLLAVIDLHHRQTDRAALRAFHASNAYLGLVLVAIVVDGLVF